MGKNKLFNSNGSTLVLSIKPIYAEKIFGGSKTVELRKTRPKRIAAGDIVLVYISSPIKSLAGAFRIDEVIEESLMDLWKKVKNRAGISYTEFSEYYNGSSIGVGLMFNEFWKIKNPIPLEIIKERCINFVPPQSFKYASNSEINLATEGLRLN